MEPIAFGDDGLVPCVMQDWATGEVLTVAYPLVTHTQTLAIWPSKPDLKMTIQWKGNSVADILPKGKGLPIDFSNPRPIPDLPIK